MWYLACLHTNGMPNLNIYFRLSTDVKIEYTNLKKHCVEPIVYPDPEVPLQNN